MMKETKVLVVEDHDELRIASLRALRNRGFVCESAEDGLRGADKLFNGEFDVLLTDLAMPGLNGHALCVQALRMRDRPAVVVLTGVVEDRISADLQTRGVDRILHKPLPFSELAAAVKEAAERRAAGGSAAPPRTEQVAERATAEQATAVENPERSAPEKKVSPRPPASALPPEPDAVDAAILIRDPKAAAAMREAFAERGLQATCLDGADKLHRLLESSDPDLVILNQKLEGFLSGTAIAQQLVERFLGPKIVLLEPADQRGSTEEEDDSISANPSEVWRLSDDTPAERVAARAAAFLRNSKGGYATISPAAHAVAASSPTAPPAPDLLRKLAHHLQQPAEEINADQVAEDISADPSAATELLRLVNSAHVGLRRRVNRISEAVKLLGASRSVSLTYAVCQKKLTAKLDAPWAEGLHRWYHRRSLLIGCAAREVLRRDHPQIAEDAFALGLLQELGIVLIAGKHGERYAQTVMSGVQRPQSADLTAVERYAVKVDHAAVSAAALEHWNFPRSVVQLVLCHHEAKITGPSTAAENRLHAAMRVGEALADLLDDRGAGRRSHFAQLLKDSGLAPGMPPKDLLANAAAAAEEFHSLLSLPAPDDDAVATSLAALSEEADSSEGAGASDPAAAGHATSASPASQDGREERRTPLRESLQKLVGA